MIYVIECIILIKLIKKLIEFTNSIYDDGKNMSLKERFRYEWLNKKNNKNKPDTKKEKIVYNKSKILKLENKSKEGIDEYIFFKKKLDLSEKSDEKLKIHKKRKKK